LTGLIIFFLGSPFNVNAQGNLLITPKRLVFGNESGSQEINLANTGSDSARYAVSFIQIRMNEKGNFEQISQPDSGQYFADKYLRIFPRTVTLGPNEAQVVKVQVRKSDKMPAGEYRSHLYFRAIDEQIAAGEKKIIKDTASVSVRLTPVFGISIPVIIRIGESTSNVHLSNVRLETLNDQSTIMHARFNRSGNMSVYGDLKIEHVSETGKRTQVGLVKGISVYTPNSTRDVRIKLDNEPGVSYRSGKLQVSYSRPSEERSAILASIEIALN
jgi:hypothetical protein